VDYGDIAAATKPLIAELDHYCLNDVTGMGDPDTGGAVADWLEDRLEPALPQLSAVRVWFEGDGTFAPRTLPAEPRTRLPARLRWSFEAAHSLPGAPEGHKCRRLHGHSFRIEVAAEPLDTLAAALEPLYTELNDTRLNALPGLELATSEVLSRWIWNRLEADGVGRLLAVVVQETCTARCVYRGEAEEPRP
jgi:6-pyruvoyltetrahydropterin/6-carboxytetrahydropterin synthase